MNWWWKNANVTVAELVTFSLETGFIKYEWLTIINHTEPPPRQYRGHRLFIFGPQCLYETILTHWMLFQDGRQVPGCQIPTFLHFPTFFVHGLCTPMPRSCTICVVLFNSFQTKKSAWKSVQAFMSYKPSKSDKTNILPFWKMCLLWG